MRQEQNLWMIIATVLRAAAAESKRLTVHKAQR